MAPLPSLQREEHDKPKGMAASHLPTPEQPFAHSFGQSFAQSGAQTPPYQTASPPASPPFSPFASQHSYIQGDDVLFPDHDNSQASGSERPLFGNQNQWTSPGRQRSPVAETSLPVPIRPSQGASPVQQTQDTPKSVAVRSRGGSQASPVGPVALLNTHGLDYWRYCVAQIESHRAARKMERWTPPTTAKPRNGVIGRDSYTEQVLRSLGRSARVEKHRGATASPSLRTARVVAQRVTPAAEVSRAAPKRESPAKRSRRQTSTPDTSFATNTQGPQPKPRTRAPPSKKIEEKDVSWLEIPDRCPPADSLDKMGKTLTVVWHNSNALDLSQDPNREHLHPQELEIAQKLRLKCDVYLANKRRIFQAKVTALKEGKEFNKTSAQTSTSIDVNKASRLWAAFDGVGWFDGAWFTEWL